MYKEIETETDIDIEDAVMDNLGDLIDLIQIREICREKEDWEAVVLPNERGIFIGTYADLHQILNKTRWEERENEL